MINKKKSDSDARINGSIAKKLDLNLATEIITKVTSYFYTHCRISLFLNKIAVGTKGGRSTK